MSSRRSRQLAFVCKNYNASTRLLSLMTWKCIHSFKQADNRKCSIKSAKYTILNAMARCPTNYCQHQNKCTFLTFLFPSDATSKNPFLENDITMSGPFEFTEGKARDVGTKSPNIFPFSYSLFLYSFQIIQNEDLCLVCYCCHSACHCLWSRCLQVNYHWCLTCGPSYRFGLQWRGWIMHE